MKLLTVTSLLFGLLIAAVPVSADEAAWGEHSGKQSMNLRIRDLKEQSYQNALEWQRKHVKQNWAQKLTGKYSNERVDEPAQKFSNQSQHSAVQSQGWKKSPDSAAPTLFSPRGGGEYKRLSHGFDTTGSGMKKESKLGLNLGSSAGSSLQSDKLGLKKEGQSAGAGGSLHWQNKGQEYDPSSQ